MQVSLRYHMTYVRMPVPWVDLREMVQVSITREKRYHCSGCVSDDLIFSKADKFVLIHIKRISPAFRRETTFA